MVPDRTSHAYSRIAQLVRASRLHREGRGFESLCGYFGSRKPVGKQVLLTCNARFDSSAGYWRAALECDMRQKRLRQALNSIETYYRRMRKKEYAAWRRDREEFNGRLEWAEQLDAPSNWSEYCKCVAKRLVSMSVQAIYRGQKSRQGRTDKNNPQPAIRIPRHYVPTRVVLCPRQSAKRRRTG